MATNNPASVLIDAVRKAVTGKPGKELAALLLENAPPDDLQGASPEMLAQLVRRQARFPQRTQTGPGEDCGRQSRRCAEWHHHHRHRQ